MGKPATTSSRIILQHKLVDVCYFFLRNVLTILYKIGMVKPTNYQYMLYDFKGVPVCRFIHDEKRLAAIQHFDEFEEDDVVIMTYPKTGTHFLGAVIQSIWAEVGRAPKLEDLTLGIAHFDIGSPVRSGEDPMSPITSRPHPRIIMTHLPWRLQPEKVQKNKVKIIYLLRNPKDQACSMYPFLLKNGQLVAGTTWDTFLDILRSKSLIYNDYLDHIRQWYPHRNDPNMKCIYYEDMKKDLAGSVKHIAEYLNVELTEEQVETIVEENKFTNAKKRVGTDLMHRSGKSGGWKSQFSVSQNTSMDKWISEGLEGLDEIKFDYGDYE